MRTNVQLFYPQFMSHSEQLLHFLIQSFDHILADPISFNLHFACLSIVWIILLSSECFSLYRFTVTKILKYTWWQWGCIVEDFKKWEVLLYFLVGDCRSGNGVKLNLETQYLKQINFNHIRKRLLSDCIYGNTQASAAFNS